MALTPQEITFYAGDTRTVVIPLKNDSDASAFTPTGYNLIFTAKASNSASDNGAKFQYSTGAGITHSTTNASTVFHPVDTRAHGGKTLYWDIQAEHLTNPDDVRTVAVGTLVLKRDTTRQTTTSVPLHTISESVPYTGPTGETPLVTSTTPPSDHDAIWFDPETGGFSVWYVDAWVAVGEGGAGGPPTAAEITAALQGAEADATKIGVEYMPSEIIASVALANSGASAITPPVGSVAVLGVNSFSRLILHDGVSNGDDLPYVLDSRDVAVFSRAYIGSEFQTAQRNETLVTFPYAAEQAVANTKLFIAGQIAIGYNGTVRPNGGFGLLFAPSESESLSTMFVPKGNGFTIGQAEAWENFDIFVELYFNDIGGGLFSLSSAGSARRGLTTRISAANAITNAVIASYGTPASAPGTLGEAGAISLVLFSGYLSGTIPAINIAGSISGSYISP